MAEPVASRISHETRDISVRAVTWFAAGLVISGMAISLGVVELFQLFKREHPSPESPSRIVQQPHVIAPPPQLQTNPTAELEQFEAAQDAKLNSYGWIDKNGGVVRIPIQRAMDLIVERGLPTRGPGMQNASGKTPVEMQNQKAAATKP